MEQGRYACEASSIFFEVSSEISRDLLTSSQVVLDSSSVVMSSMLSSSEPYAVESM